MPSRTPVCSRAQRIEWLTEALKTISEPNRLRILCFLKGGERCVCEIERDLGISQQLASHHANVLKNAKFLKLRKRGTQSYYSLDEVHLNQVLNALTELLKSTDGCAASSSLPTCEEASL